MQEATVPRGTLRFDPETASSDRMLLVVAYSDSVEQLEIDFARTFAPAPAAYVFATAPPATESNIERMLECP